MKWQKLLLLIGRVINYSRLGEIIRRGNYIEGPNTAFYWAPRWKSTERSVKKVTTNNSL